MISAVPAAFRFRRFLRRACCARLARCGGLATLGLLAAPASASIVPITWNGTTGNWTDTTRWNVAGVFPNNNVTDQYNVTFGAGTATLTQDITVNQLTFTGGTITGPFNFTVVGNATLNNGLLSGAGTTTLQGATTFAGSTFGLDAGRTLRNEGSATWNTGTIDLNANTGAGYGSMVNAAGATFTSNSASSLSLTSSNQSVSDTGVGAKFSNLGTFVKSGVGTTTVSAAFDNSGTVNVTAGTLSLGGGGTHTGTFTSAAGATLNLNLGTHTLTGITASGAGKFQLSGGTANFEGASAIGSAFTQSGGTLGGAGTVTVMGSATLTGGMQTGAGTTTLQGATTMTASSYGLDAGRTLRNEGAFTWNTGTIDLNANTGAGYGSIVNAAGATFTASSAGALSMASSNQGASDTGVGATFTNQGTFVKAGAGTTSINNFFDNSGTVNVQGGMLYLQGGGTHTGTFTGTAGTVNLNAGAHSLTNVTSSGTATFQVGGGTSNFSGTNTLASSVLFSGGTIGGTGTIYVTGAATQSGGMQTGAGLTVYQGTTGITALSLDAGRTVRNEGSATWTAGAIDLNANTGAGYGAIVNAVGATFTANTGGSLTMNSSNQGAGDGGVGATFSNQGTFVKAGTGTTFLSSLFDNSGTVTLQGGTLYLQGGGTHTGAFTGTGGTVYFNSGTHSLTNVTSSGSMTFQIGAGSETFSGPNTLGSAVVFSGGTIGGTGTIYVTGSATQSGSMHTGAGSTVFQGTTAITSLNLDSGRTVRNEGNATWTAGSIDLNANTGTGFGTIVNAAGATFTANSGATLSMSASNQGGADTGVGATFTNQGTFVKAGAGATSIYNVFDNSGTVNAQAGTLTLNGGGTHTGTFSGAAGGIVSLDNGTHTLTNIAGTGAGLFRINGAAVTANFEGTSTIASGFTHASGALGGSGTLNLTGATTLSGGRQTGAGTTVLQGTTTLTALNLDAGRAVRNEGALNWTSGTIDLNANVGAGFGSLVNAAGGTFNANSASSLTLQSSNQGVADTGVGATFANQGTFVKAGSGSAQFLTNFNNTGTTDVTAGSLILSSVITQHSGTTLTGGTWIVRDGATLNFATAGAVNITANQGDVTLVGAGANFAKLTGSLVNNSGAFRLLGNRSWTAPGAFTNSGTLQLGGGTFSAPSLANTGTGEIQGFGTVNLRPTNDGTVRAAGGTLTFLNGLLDGATVGTRAQSDAGATLDLSGGASGSRADYLANNGSLALGANTFLVDKDYTNANWGTGNSFNARANVTGAGVINSTGDTGQSLSGASLTGGTTDTATLAFGNLREGSVVARTFNVNNTGTTGADLRGALQTTANGGTLSDARFTGTGVTAANFGPIATGGAQSFGITLNGTAAGAVTGQQIHVANNFDNVADQNLVLTGTVYRAAAANTIAPNPLNLGNTREGGSLTGTLAINNAAGDTGGFTETLSGVVSNVTGVASASGSFSGLAFNGGTTNAIGVSLNPAIAGTRNGSVTVDFYSTEINGSGLGTIAAGSQTVNLTGAVYRAAAANTLTPNPMNFGNARIGGTLAGNLAISNTAGDTGGFTETLGATVTGTTGAASTTGSLSGLAFNGGVSNAIGVSLDTSSAGNKSGTATVAFTSTEINGSGLGTIGVGSQTVTANGTVYKAAAANTLAPNPLNLGSTRLGGTLAANLAINNAAGDTGGFTETLGGSVTGTTGALNATGSFNGLAFDGGTTNAIGVSLNTATAGAKTGTATIGFTTTAINGSGLGTVGAGSQTITANGSVYQTASAGTLTPTVNVGIVHVGDTVTRNLSVTNAAPATGGFTETLGATGSALSPRLSIAGSASGVAAGATATNAFTVTLDTSTAGVVSGAQAKLDFTSQAAAGSGLSDLALGSQTVAFNATVNNYAALGVSFGSGAGSLIVTGANSATLDLGVFNLGDAAATSLLLFGNTASGPADTLSISFSSLGGPFALTGFNPTSGIAAGSSMSGQVVFDPTAKGTWTQTVDLINRSQNLGGFDGALANFNLTLTATVIPEPKTYALLLAAASGVVVLIRRRVAKNRQF